jgi:RNA polymerase-binding transcription factor DksA
MSIDYKHFKAKLEAEKAMLEKELEEVARRNPDNPSDWEPISGTKDSSQADDNVLADAVEDYEENVALVRTLEKKYQDINKALDKIEKGNYGICEISGEEIELDRLEANPAATTCKKHMDQS